MAKHTELDEVDLVHTSPSTENHGMVSSLSRMNKSKSFTGPTNSSNLAGHIITHQLITGTYFPERDFLSMKHD